MKIKTKTKTVYAPAPKAAVFPDDCQQSKTWKAISNVSIRLSRSSDNLF